MYVSIGNTDITSYVQETTYTMNQFDEYEEWKDGNRTKHRETMRTYVEGSFDLVFVTETAFNNFLTLLNNNTTDGVLTITVYVQNINQNKTCQMFKTLENVNDRKISNSYFYKRLTLTLVER